MDRLSVYIHIPFCVSKCLYCDFLSAPAALPVQESYVEALLCEIEKEAVKYRVAKVDTIFFGGGTPSVLPPSQIAEILHKVKACFTVSEEAEISIEVNPGTVTEEALCIYKEAGINRLSIGLQSFAEAELRQLGRIHTPQQFTDTFAAARKAGFDNINVDIMSALPNQTMESYKMTVEKVLALQPEHISSYSLIIEEGTPFYDMPLVLPDEETDRQMYAYTESILKEHDYHRYEISNYAKDGYECRHNKAYWTRQNYIGFGPGAASMVDNVRWTNCRDLNAWEHIGQKEQVQQLSIPEQMEEFMFLGLRLTDGVDGADFYKQFGQEIEAVYGKVLHKLKEEGLLRTDGRIRLTKHGFDVSNYAMAEFLFVV